MQTPCKKPVNIVVSPGKIVCLLTLIMHTPLRKAHAREELITSCAPVVYTLCTRCPRCITVSDRETSESGARFRSLCRTPCPSTSTGPGPKIRGNAVLREKRTKSCTNHANIVLTSCKARVKIMQTARDRHRKSCNSHAKSP